VTDTVDAMLEAEGDGEIDFMENLAPDLPARFMTKLIGTPETDYTLLRRWANAFMVTSDFTLEERNQCNEELAAYYTDAVLARYRDLEQGMTLPDDLMSAFMQAEYEGEKLTREEVIRFCITLVVAGAETTGYLLGNLVCTLVEEPDFFPLLKEDRSKIRPFIEESLRRDGPIQRLFRVAMADCEVGGVTIREGDWVGVFFASANRDPAVWEDPDKFVLGRPNIARQLTFSHGIHHCLGSGIARLEADRMLNGLLDRYTRIEAGSRPMKRQSGGLLNYGLEECPIRLVR
jgi:cytochrome P450